MGLQVSLCMCRRWVTATKAVGCNPGIFPLALICIHTHKLLRIYHGAALWGSHRCNIMALAGGAWLVVAGCIFSMPAQG